MDALTAESSCLAPSSHNYCCYYYCYCKTRSFM